MKPQQLNDHDYNFGLAEKGKSVADIITEYAQYTGVSLDNEDNLEQQLEHLLSVIIKRGAVGQAQLEDLNCHDVALADVVKISETDDYLPPDEQQDEIAELRGEVEEAIADYRGHLERSGVVLSTPPERVARYVVLAMLGACEDDL